MTGQHGQHSFAGTDINAVQTLARHSDPKLTLNTYTKLGIHDLGKALDGLPGIDRPDDANERAVLRAVATYDHRPTPPGGSRNQRHSHGQTVQRGAKWADCESFPPIGTTLLTVQA